MAQAATNPKIEELRFRLKTDPRSRLFYQLAEELRKSGQLVEAEQVLRSGLAVYPTYLAAWVSLGRVLREVKNDAGAVEALNKAMQLDPGNVVAARLLADAHLSLGDKVEAIKKYKLVLALMPQEEELKGTIERLDREIQGIHPAAVEEMPVATEVADEAARALAEDEPPPMFAATAPAEELSPAASETPAFALDDTAPPLRASWTSEAAVPEFEPPAPEAEEESPFDRTSPPFAEDDAIATGDVEPMLSAHEESPFEEPVGGATAAAIEIEQPMGMHIDVAPVSAELAAPVVEDEEADVFAPAAPEAPAPAEDLTNTLTMADLYVRQGLVNEASHIYENILARDPENTEVRAKLDAITPHVNAKIERLERWLAKVSRKEVAGV
jgi:tetratricopeptide (TPR) repeat protein